MWDWTLKDQIIEMACLITDSDLNILAEVMMPCITHLSLSLPTPPHLFI